MAKPPADLLQGTLDVLVLKTLSWGPRHGYAIGRWLEDSSKDTLRIEEGSLYPALYRIEQRGWIKSKWGTNETGRKAKFYTLTKPGRKQLIVEEESWDLLALAIAKIRQAT